MTFCVPERESLEPKQRSDCIPLRELATGGRRDRGGGDTGSDVAISRPYWVIKPVNNKLTDSLYVMQQD